MPPRRPQNPHMALLPGDSGTLLQLVFDHAGEGISVFDAQMRLQAHNQRFLDCTDLPAALAQPGTPLIVLLRAMADAGEFGPFTDAASREADCQRRLTELQASPAQLTQRQRPNGRTLEMRRTPTPEGGFVMLYADITLRRAAEHALLHQQRMLDQVQQTTGQGFWFIDTEQRTIDANPAMCRILGVERSALLGRTIWEFVDNANSEVFRRNVALREQGISNGYEVTLRSADGLAVHCINNASPLLDALGRPVGALGLFSNISALKKAQAEVQLTGQLLAQKKHVLEVTLDSLLQGVLSVDGHGNINAWNRRCLELLEVPASYMQTRPSFLSLCRWQVEHGLPEPQPLAWPPRINPYQRVRHDGVVLAVQTHVATDGGIVHTYTDITASALAERALRESESRFRTLADGAPALIWLSDLDGNAYWFNQCWLGVTGQTLEVELTRTWADRMHPDDLVRCREVFEQARLSRQGYQIEFRLQAADGSLVWIADHGVPRFDSDGGFEGFVVYGWDITARRQAEAALLRAKEEAERANQAKSEFLSRMSHELRTPLNAVLGFAQLLQTDIQDPLSPQQEARVQELLRGGRHLLTLINDVLDLARIEAGALQLQLVTVDMAEVVGDCLRLVAPNAEERRIRLQVKPDAPGACRVQADPTRLRQVLLNLLSNALKYNRTGGSVTVTWQTSANGHTVQLNVQDTGPGLSAAQQERLFQPFERLEASQSAIEGAGIGLALSKWLVSLMQGDMGVDSEPGHGSRFWVRLASADSITAELMTQPSAPTHSLSAPRRSTVLYIEDNAVNQLLMEGMLARRPGVRLLSAALPETGLSMALQAQPELVLLDIQLPGMDGYEVLRRLRADVRTRHIPVVAVSANAMPDDLQQARNAGFTDYVTKPVDLAALLAAVSRVLDSAESMQG